MGEPVLSRRSGLSWFGVFLTLTLPVGVLFFIVATTAVYGWAQWVGIVLLALIVLGWLVGWFRGGFAMPAEAAEPMQFVLRPTQVESDAYLDQRGYRRWYVRLALAGLVVGAALLFTTTGL